MTTQRHPVPPDLPLPRHCSTKPWRDPISGAGGLTGRDADVDEVQKAAVGTWDVPTAASWRASRAGADRRSAAAPLRHYGSSTTFPPACPSRTNCRASAASASG